MRAPRHAQRWATLARTQRRAHSTRARPGRLHSHAATGAATARNADREAVAVIVGGTRGIGAGLARALCHGRWAGKVIVCGRSVDELSDEHTRVYMDVCDETSVSQAAARVGPRVDMLLYTAGMLHADGLRPETAISRVDARLMRATFDTNALGALLVLKHFSGALRSAEGVAGLLSARVGSISDNALGGWVSYRASKAAVNQIVATAAIELARSGVVVAGLHPGTVDTGLSRPFQSNVPKGRLFAVDDVAAWLLDVVDSLRIADAGGCYAYDRQLIPP